MTRVVEVPQSSGGVGVARADITPPVGIYHRMWGAALHDRAEGVHRPLTATALYLRSAAHADEQQLFIALDHCLLGEREAEDIVAAIEQQTGVPRGSVVLCYSHTHAAGLMLPDRSDQPGGDLIAPYLEQLKVRLVAAAGQAREQAQAATMVYGVGHCRLARQRDFWDEATQQFVCGFNPDGGGDDTLLVARITSADGSLLATVLNYACHPTTLAWDNRLISPDFPGVACALVERETGAPCIFFQGASGDLGPREGFTGELEVAERNGRELGYAALATLSALAPPHACYAYQGPVVSGATLGVWRYEPITEPRRTALASWKAYRGELPLAYRPELPTRDHVQAARQQWLEREQAARAAGDQDAIRECRAMVERQTRLLGRLELLPPGPDYPLRALVLRFGDAVWVAMQGEPYSQLQQTLRARFPEVPIVVIGIAYSWGPGYLPPQDRYGQGIYQESIAVLAAGCLEELIERLAALIGRV